MAAGAILMIGPLALNLVDPEPRPERGLVINQPLLMAAIHVVAVPPSHVPAPSNRAQFMVVGAILMIGPLALNLVDPEPRPERGLVTNQPLLTAAINVVVVLLSHGPVP